MKLRILFVEDTPDDAELVLRRLREADIEPQWQRVDTEATLREALATEQWDVALVDYNLPGFGGLQALRVLAETAPDLPAVTISGAISEETAVTTITAGAVDYVLKDNLTRLAPAVLRAVEGAELRRRQRRAAEQARQSQFAVDHASQAIVYVSEDGALLYVNQAAERLGGVAFGEALGEKIWGWSPLVDEQRWAELWRAAAQGPIVDYETSMKLRDGEERLVSATLERLQRDEGAFMIVYLRDVTEERAAEARAAETEARYERLTDNAPDIVFRYELSPSAGLVYINPAVEAITGYSPQECYAEPQLVLTMIHPDDAPLMAGMLQSLSLPDEPMLMRWIGKDGVTRWMESRIVPVRDADGQLLAVEGITRDVTQSKHAEEELRASKQLLEGAMNAIPVRVFWKDKDLVYLGCNAVFARDAGFSDPADLVGKDDYQMGWRDQAELYRADDLRVIESGRATGLIEEPQTTPEGDTITLLTSKMPLHGPDGEINGVLGTYMDITERKQAEDRTAHFRDLLEYVVAHAGSAIAIHDRDLNYIYVSERYLREYGVKDENVIGKHHYEVFPDLPQKWRDVHQRALAGEVCSADRDPYPREDGSVDWTRWECRPWYEADGSVGGIIVYTEVITERVEAEEALRESEERFRRVSESTTDFAYSCVKPPGGPFTFDWLTGAVERITGHGNDVLLGWGCWKALVVEEDVPIFEERVTGLAPGESSVCELRIRDKQGAVRWLTVYSEMAGGPGDPATHRLYGACQDITERRRAEGALRESETHFRAFFEQASIGMATTSLEKGWLEVNGTLCDMLGYTRDELGAITWAELTFPEDLAADETQWVRVVAGEMDGYALDKRFVRKDGGIVHTHLTVRAVRDPDGAFGYIAAVLEDITERKQAEAALRESEQRFTEFAEHLPGHLWIRDREHRYLFANAQTAADVRRDPLDLLGAAPADLWDAEVAARIVAIDDAALRGDVVDDIGRWLTGGRERVLHTLMFPIAGGDEPTMVGGLAFDVTDEQQAHEEVRHHAERLRRTVEGAVLAMSNVVETRDPYTAGHERRVAELAVAIGAEMGMGGEELNGLRLASLIHDIGKIGVPAEILAKPGKLSVVEFNLIKQHAQSGYDILQAIEFDQPVAEMALQHHERQDGSGYPQGLAGEDILPESRILAVADVVEAMSSHRPYRAALGIEVALAEIRDNAGVKYDAAVAAACLRVVEEQGFAFTP